MIEGRMIWLDKKTFDKLLSADWWEHEMDHENGIEATMRTSVNDYEVTIEIIDWGSNNRILDHSDYRT